MNFLSNLIWSNSKKFREDIKLYFDRLKKSYLKLKISEEFTCKDIINMKNSEIYSCLALKFKDEVINMNDYSFVLINNESSNLIEIKLKYNDKISNFLTKNTIDIYFLNLKEIDEKNREVNKIINNEIMQKRVISSNIF